MKKAIAYFKEGVYTIVSVVKGHIITLRNFFRPKVTMQYPEVRWEIPEGYRGLPCLPVDPETGQDTCIGCGACARACPTQLIEVKAHMGPDKKRIVDSFTMKLERCTFCGMCEEVCPADAIHMSHIYEADEFNREDLFYDRAKLNAAGGVREPKPTEEEKPADAPETGTKKQDGEGS